MGTERLQRERVFTPAEVAEVLRVTEETILDAILRGRLRAIQVSESEYRITAGDLRSWIGQDHFAELFPRRADPEVAERAYDFFNAWVSQLEELGWPSEPSIGRPVRRIRVEPLVMPGEEPPRLSQKEAKQDEEARMLALELVHRARDDVEREVEGPAPSPEEVRQRRQQRGFRVS